MDKQAKIRCELEDAEFWSNRHLRSWRSTLSLYYYDCHQHFEARRRFFLNRLLRIQLKEFNRD